MECNIMYAEHRYQPRQPRTASIGASLAISGAIVAALVYASPNVVKQVIHTFPVRNYPQTPIPPIDEPKPLPKAEHKPVTQPPVVAPKPLVESKTETAIDTTPDIPIVPPKPLEPLDKGPVVLADPPAKPAEPPALVGARRDPRFAEDFQPAYPAAEIRAQRDGRVAVRVLVGADGRVKAVEQISATSDAFFDATRRQALSRWRFKPATRGGVPQESWMTLSVTFRIEDQ
jgi:periplasmic protein TonB